MLVVACGVGIAGLLLGSSNPEGASYWVGLALFVAAIIFSGWVIKRYFDQVDRLRR
jgi:hypothetical protein